MADAESLKRTLDSIEKSIKNIEKFAAENLNNPDADADEICVRKNRVEVLLNKYMETEQQLFQFNKEHDSLFHTIEDIYFTASSKLNKIESARRTSTQLNSRAPFDSTSINNTGMQYGGRPHSSEVKLPRLSLPRFSGNYIEWQSFCQLFMKQVD